MQICSFYKIPCASESQGRKYSKCLYYLKINGSFYLGEKYKTGDIDSGCSIKKKNQQRKTMSQTKKMSQSYEN